jgi:hypothetical protein
MKLRNSVIAIAAVAMAATIQTAQAAFTDNLADLIAHNGSLTIDDKTFTGFSFVESGLTSFNAANIIVTAYFNPVTGYDYLTWSGNISFVSASTASADIVLNYIVTANVGAIDMIDQAYTGSSLNGLLAVDETAAIGAFGGTVAGYSHLQIGDLSDPPAEASDLLNIVPPESVLYVTKDIAFGVTSANGGFVSISQVAQSFHQVPEPTTIIAGALLLLPFGASTLRILRKNRTA